VLVVLPVALSMVPIAIGMAVLRYRLYDLDQIINPTLVYGLLTALLGGAYVGTVLVLGQVFGGIGGQPPSWVVAGTTLAVAVLFQPARRRIQQVVDRRFNRRKYDAAKTVQAFSVRLRDEVDLDALSNELLAVAHQTMQPTMAALWLRPSTQARPHGQGQASSARLTRLDPLHAMQFRAPPPPQVRDRRPAQRPDSSDRDCPLVTAAYGTRVARPASRTRPPPGGDGSQIGQR
jgi:hypothetical protein